MAEKLDKNTTKSAASYSSSATLRAEEELKTDFFISEDNLSNALDNKLKEEIAAQSLILSSLSGTPSTQETVHQEQQNLPQIESNLPLKSEKNMSSEHTDLAFDVSQAIGVEMIAIQQDVNESTSTVDVKEISVASDYLNTQNQVAGSILDTGLSGSSVVLNAIAIKGANGVTEIQFEGTDIIDSAEVDAITHEPQQETEIGRIDEDGIVNFTSNEIELPSTEQLKYPKLFVATTAQEAHEIIKKYAEETMSTFVSMRKMKQFGITEGGIDLTKKNYRVFFESSDVDYDGIPYVYVADKMYICHLGKDKTEVTRQKIRQQSMERRMKMGLPTKDLSSTRLRTKKIDCPVKITVKMIAKFPQYKVIRKTKRVCETASKKVRQALVETNGKLSCYYSFVGRLPGTREHNHLVGEENSEHEPIDPLIKDKIIQLTWEGIPSSNEVKRLLEEYVERDLFAGKATPSKLRRRYYPNVKDIRNYMNKAKMLTRLSSDIKEELRLLASKLQQTRPTENIILQSELLDAGQEALLQLKTSADDDPMPKPTLIFCHQTSQQQRLLKRYGNQVMICEVTNLVERVPFPLICLFVQTNVDYQMVGSFVVEVRNKESLQQGLMSIKEWNPGWSPKYVILDYSDEQAEAVKIVFPGCSQFISESSRERSWRQWLTKSENKILGDPSQVFQQFQAIANAYNEEVLHQAALQLENSDVWRESANLRSWFNSNWLLEAKRWVVGYRPDDFIVTLHNESTFEQDIKSLRDAHINLMRGKKLGALIERLVERIIPDFYRRYIELNRKSYTQANELKVLYGDQLPTCLVNKPAAVIMHVLDQIKSTEATVYQVSHVQPGVFWVQDASSGNANDQAHTVSFGDATNLPSCDCFDWQRFKLPCKHLCSVFSSFPDWGWDMLNASYTANPLINLDYSCIKPWVDAQDKQEQRLSHFTTAPTFNLKGNESKVATSKLDSIEKAINANDIKISDVELEVPVSASNGSASSESGLLNINAVGDNVSEQQKNVLAVQCEDLLQNLAQISTELANSDQLERLKSDLQASIGMFRSPSGTTLSENQSSKRNVEDEDSTDADVKKLKIDLERSDSSVDELYVSEEEERVGIHVDDGTDIEDETVEISTQDEETPPRTPDQNIEITNEDVPMHTVLTRPPVQELTPEQRERKLLAILTASNN